MIWMWDTLTPALAVVGALVTGTALVVAAGFVYLEIEEHVQRRQWVRWREAWRLRHAGFR
jgi:hypothetical protein